MSDSFHNRNPPGQLPNLNFPNTTKPPSIPNQHKRFQTPTPKTTMPPRIHLLRHAQGQHQLEPTSQNSLLHDPPLTPHGRLQSKSFASTFPLETYPIDLICASPLRRTIQTAQICFPSSPRPIILLPDAQEASDLPSDTGSEWGVLEGEFGDAVDGGLVGEGWNSKKGEYASDVASLEARARRLRGWLRGREEREVAVVGHGLFWHFLVGEVDAEGRQLSMFPPVSFLFSFD